MSEKLEKMCQDAWQAYEYLRDHDLSEQSGTSKRLRAVDLPKLRHRLIEELRELEGVVLGTHIHEGLPHDIVLEGYEVFYWAVCYAVAQKYPYQRVEPGRMLQEGYQDAILDPAELGADIEETALALEQGAGDLVPLQEALRQVGRTCAFGSIPPTRLLERDLFEMRQKEYLREFWNSREK